MNTSEQKAVLTIAMMAALADGGSSDAERDALRQMAEKFGPDAGVNLWEIYNDVLNRRRPLSEVAAQLTSPEARTAAWEIANGVCEADGSINDQERAFLDSLRGALNLGASTPPPAPASEAVLRLEPADTKAIDKMIIDYAILNGALELLPQGLATMAIVPLQMRMVYRIGKSYGYTLDRGHIRDFVATAGVGLASQAVENVARNILGGLAGSLLGGLGRAIASTAAGAAFTFAGTYAIGQLANRYYAGGRKMEAAVMRDTYARLVVEGKTFFVGHTGAVHARASNLNVNEVINLVRQPL